MSLPLEARAPHAPRRIAIASGKGGVGKTWLAITLAHACARAGRRTVLFDGDLGLANVDVQLGCVPRADLGGVLAGQVSLDDCAALVPATGFRLLAGRSGDLAIASLDPRRLDRLLSEIAALEADTVLLDCAAGLDAPVRHMASAADTLLLVTTEEPTAITDAYALLKCVIRGGRTCDARIVVNQATSEAGGERAYAALARAAETFLGRRPPLAGIVRRDPRVGEAIRAQVPLLTRHPHAPAALDVTKLADALT